VGVDIRLVPTLAPPRRVVAALVGWNEAVRLKKLVYTLPPVLLHGHQLAVTDRGLLLVASEGVDVVPLGTLLSEVAPGLLIPIGMELVPRVPTEVLSAAIEHELGEAKRGDTSRRLTVFPHDGRPFFVDAGKLQPLERQALARIQVPEAEAADLTANPPAGTPRVVNDRVGRFALWGFHKDR
jgi:hypothetical protein